MSVRSIFSTAHSYHHSSCLKTHLLFKSTSAFLQTKLEYRLPTPLISVRANMILRRPSTLVLRRRRMCCWERKKRKRDVTWLAIFLIDEGLSRGVFPSCHVLSRRHPGMSKIPPPDLIIIISHPTIPIQPCIPIILPLFSPQYPSFGL